MSRGSTIFSVQRGGWVAVLILLTARQIEAGCNVIPPAVQTFRSSLGSLDRPFAALPA